MPQIQTVLEKHFPTSGSNAKGQWTRHDFKAADGWKCQTFEASLGNKAYGLLGQPALITYEEVTRGDFTNNVIKSIEAVDAAAPVAPRDDPPTVTAPTSYNDTERELRIMRQSALERAILIHQAGLVPEGDINDAIKLSDSLIAYFQTGEFSLELVPLGFES